MDLLGVPSRHPGPWSFSINARRTAHAGKATQSHSWSFSLPGSAIVISASLGTVTINTHASLGTFGTITMRLTKRSKEHTVNTKCKKTGKLLFSSSSRTGKLGGSFDFKPNAGAGLPIDVKKAPIGVSVSKFVNTGRNCPGGGGGGGGGPGGCAVSRSFNGNIFLTPPTLTMSAVPTGKTSFMSFSQNMFPPTAPATSISHSITVSGPATAVKIANNGNVTVNGGVGTPFLSNTKLSYTGGSSTTSTFGKCKIITITDAFGSGSLTVNFDTGPVTLDVTHPFDLATTSRIVKA